MLLSGERIDQLYADDIQIIQSKEVFSFSIDAVLLANFPQLPKKGKIVDLCAGNGAVGLFVSRKTAAKIDQIELQPRLADMGQRSILLNKLEKQVTMYERDLKQATEVIKKDSVDLVLCNPPYFKERPTSQKNPNPHLAIARHEIHTSLQEVVTVDILHAMENANIAPKKARFVYPKPGKEANVLLIEGIKQGKKDGFRVLPPLFTYNEKNEYEAEMKAMLYGE